MRRKPDEGICKVGSAVLHWAKRWKKMRGEYILNLVTYISQHNERVMREGARAPGDRIKVCM